MPYYYPAGSQFERLPIVKIKNGYAVAIDWTVKFCFREDGSRALDGHAVLLWEEEGKARLWEVSVSPNGSPSPEAKRAILEIQSGDITVCGREDLKRFIPGLRTLIRDRKKLSVEGMSAGIEAGFRDRAIRSALGACMESKYSYRQLWNDPELLCSVLGGTN